MFGRLFSSACVHVGYIVFVGFILCGYFLIIAGRGVPFCRIGWLVPVGLQESSGTEQCDQARRTE